jgi:hypothetical protein
MNKNEQIDMARIWQEQHMNNGCGTPLYIAVVFIVVLFLSSCATRTVVEYRDRDVNHYITNTVHDTLVDKTTDSVYFETIVKGDTVYQTKYKEKTRWRDRIIERHDTCWRDSVVTEYKERVDEVVKFPKTYWLFLGISIISIIFAFVKLLRWLRII